MLAKPADARNRVLVALERNRVVGFALTWPAVDPDCDPVADGELAEVTLDPAERGKGHGSRLLQAAVDTLAADRFTRAVTWVNAGDDALRGFLTEAGWAPDTAHRELDLDGTGLHDRQAGPPAHRHRLRPLGLSGRTSNPPQGRLFFTWHESPWMIWLLRRSPHGGFEMLGPLPALHRLVLVLTALVVFIGIGVWLGMMPEVPLNVRLGLLVGVGAGVAAAFVLVHDFQRSGMGTRPGRRRAHYALASGVTEPALSSSERSGIVRDGLAVGIATGAYGISFGAVAVASGLSVAADLRAVAADVHRRQPVRAGRRRRRRWRPPVRGRDRDAARHPQHPLRPADGARCSSGAAGAEWPPPTC